MIAIIFFILGYGIAGYSGFNDLGFHFIIISAFINWIGYLITNISLAYSFIITGSILALILDLFKALARMSISTGAVYFIASFIEVMLK